MRGPGLDFARLTNLADGIFAVAMTFLAFTIQLPATSSQSSDGFLASIVVAQFRPCSPLRAGRCCLLPATLSVDAFRCAANPEIQTTFCSRSFAISASP